MDVHFSLRKTHGFSVAGFIAFGWWGILKAPWNTPMFSERYGYETFHSLGFGWRWQIRRVRQLVNAPDKEG